ncbi:hypothetical protein GobsT_23220 [Gemmata obscuriglobus]|uniref:Uncharacterized protein n=1 Tax=Gemmata obscuriglobus TaxID=114 RepID=A0A2Z3H025_9BACT|nr:hypothetical protein [Gemmata obscuriglobus]AWM39363.1 hypothetical protein C1280_21830 [Gemmata obscuriglobus]QEG27566.1 hypothetical protein GobsT_23220 [Gemmata obscuriglobus]VTS04653.1 unnamed protein product [Gemmata obscuriglobus UQM 2246]
MSTEPVPTSPAEIAEAEGVTADACLKAIWALTDQLDAMACQLQEFCDVFKRFTDDKALAPVFRDAVGVAWALDQFIGLQYGQLPYWTVDGERVVPATNVAGDTRHAA